MFFVVVFLMGEGGERSIAEYLRNRWANTDIKNTRNGKRTLDFPVNPSVDNLRTASFDRRIRSTCHCSLRCPSQIQGSNLAVHTLGAMGVNF